VIIGPGIGCQSLLQRGLHHIHPELPAACFHERECAILVLSVGGGGGAHKNFV